MAEKKCGLMPPGLGPLVQGLLGCLCIAVLAYKCSIDKSGRGTVRFAFDSSKNLAGAAWMHVANLLVAGLLGRVASSGGDACQWYFIEIMVDTTIGVYVEYKLLEGLLISLRNSGVEWMLRFAESIEAPCIVHETASAAPARKPSRTSSGKAEPFLPSPSWTASQTKTQQHLLQDISGLLEKLDKQRYAMQLAIWLSVVTGMKLIMVMIMLALSPQLEAVSGFVLDPLKDPTVKLLVVMVLTPGVMNAVQFWLQDNIFVDVAKWHDRRQAVLAEAHELGMNSGKVNEEIKTIDQKLNKEQQELKESQQACLNMMEGSFVDPVMMKKQLQITFDLVNRCQGVQEQKYNALRADNDSKTYELQRRSDGNFVKDVVRVNAEQAEDRYTPKFTVRANQPQADQYVAVYFYNDGAHGAVDLSKAHRLTTRCNEWPKWDSKSIPLDRHLHIHQYNFLLRQEGTDEVVRWEDCGRRILHSGEYPPTADFDKPAPGYA